MHTIEKGLNKKQKGALAKGPKNTLLEALYMSYASSWKTIGPKKNERTQGKENKHKKSLLEPIGGHKLGD